MSDGAATTLSVCVRGHTACVRVSGRANFTSSVDFKRLVQQLQDGGCDELVLDLHECRLMDSTFLGVLASLASKCEETGRAGHRCAVELFRPSERVSELLENLGVLELFKIINQVPPFECFQPIEEGDVSKVELTQTCLEAHQTLMGTTPENQDRFKDVTEYFEKTLRDSQKNGS
jgi:anti-anti-sigma factor